MTGRFASLVGSTWLIGSCVNNAKPKGLKTGNSSMRGATVGIASSALPCTESIKRISQNEAVNEYAEESSTEAEASFFIICGRPAFTFLCFPPRGSRNRFSDLPFRCVWWLVACSFVEITCRLRWKNIEIFTGVNVKRRNDRNYHLSFHWIDKLNNEHQLFWFSVQIKGNDYWCQGQYTIEKNIYTVLIDSSLASRMSFSTNFFNVILWIFYFFNILVWNAFSCSFS